MGPWKWTLCVSLLVCCVDGSASKDQTAKPGDNVTLQCLGTRGAEILVVKWIRPDLKEEKGGYVFFFRENRSYENNQHPFFRGRVKLINPEKDEDFSVILKNVRINDTGSNNKPVHTISLTVTDSHPGSTGGRTGEGGDEDGGDKDGGNTDRNHGLAVGLSVVAVVLVGVVGFLIYKKKRGLIEQKSYQPVVQPADGTKMEQV